MSLVDDVQCVLDIRRVSSTGASSTRFDSASYHSLKSRVHCLKQEQKRLVRTEQEVRQAESAALIEEKQRHASDIQRFEEQIAALQRQLKQSTERSAKMRAHHEREKKGLQSQLDAANKTLEGVDAQHAAQVAELTARHESELRRMREALDAAHADMEAAAVAAAAAQAAAVEEVDGWCTGEIEAVRVKAAREVDAAREQAAQWQQKLNLEVEKRSEVEVQLQEAEARASQAGAEAARLAEEVEVWRQRCKALQGQVVGEREAGAAALAAQAEALGAAHKEEVSSLKARHAAALDEVGVRVAGVVGRKDEALAALRAELGAVSARLAALQAL